jgi:four helix bundle protein
MKSYKELDIYQISIDLFFKTHMLSLKLPKYELYELGSQLRRSADSINSNIVEGYGRRTYKKDFIKFLIYAHASCLETINHLIKIERIYGELELEINQLIQDYDELNAKIYKFIEYVKYNWRT